MRFVWRWIAYKICGYSIEMYNNQIKNDIKEMKNVLQKYLNKAGVSMNNGKKL